MLFFIVFTVFRPHQQHKRVMISLVYYCERRGGHGWLVPSAADVIRGAALMWGVKLLTYGRVSSFIAAGDPTSCQLNSKSQLHPQPHADSWKREHN